MRGFQAIRMKQMGLIHSRRKEAKKTSVFDYRTSEFEHRTLSSI